MVAVSKNSAEIHRKNSGKSARDYELCARYANFIQLMVVGIPAVYWFVVTGYQATAFIGILTKGEISPPMHFYLPGFNESDRVQMSILLLINVILGYYGATLVAAADLFTGINVASVPMFSTIIQREINDYKTELQENKKNRNLMAIKRRLVEIMEMHMKYNE